MVRRGYSFCLKTRYIVTILANINVRELIRAWAQYNLTFLVLNSVHYALTYTEYWKSIKFSFGQVQPQHTIYLDHFHLPVTKLACVHSVPGFFSFYIAYALYLAKFKEIPPSPVGKSVRNVLDCSFYHQGRNREKHIKFFNYILL